MSGFSPYLLFRRGTLQLPALAGLVPEQTLALLDEAEAGRRRRAGLAARLADELYALVGAAGPAQRRALLRIRRDVHNDRPSPVTAATAAATDAQLPARCAELLRCWQHEQHAAGQLEARTEQAFADDLATARKTLAEVAVQEDFQRGLQLSGTDVHRELTEYAADPFAPGRKPSRRRRAESTITSYAYRVVFKPSPFGSFTEIGATPWPAPGTDPAPGGHRVARSRLNIGLLAWLEQHLRGLPGAEHLMRIRLNNSLVVDGEQAVFVRRPLEGGLDGFVPDRVVTARNSALLGLLREHLGTQERTEHELRAVLVAAGLSEPDAARTLDKLVSVGLCHRGIGLPDQTVGLPAALAGRLRAFGDGPGGVEAVRCAEVFERLGGIEREFAPAAAARRSELLAELHEQVRRFVDLRGCAPPADEAMRAVIYEDVGTTAPPGTFDAGRLRDNAAHLALLQRLVPVLDDASIEKLGLYRFFVDRFGEEPAGVPFLRLYQAFDELSAPEASAVMTGAGDEHSTMVHTLRTEFFDLLRAELAAAGDAAELRLDAARLAAFVDRLPGTLPPWRSAAYRMQFGAPGEPVVVNGMTTGHGVFFSRFCDLLAPQRPGDWDLAEAIRAHVAAEDGRQSDLTATLGLNFNLHPRLSPQELLYPGSVARPGAPNLHTLADLVVRPDPATRRLTLSSTVDGKPINLVPFNFLYPAAAPMLYRFLCAFAPTRTYRGGLWEQLDRAERPAAHNGRPRVLLGDLVLDRRSWRVPVAGLPELTGLERQELSALTGFDTWRRAAGLPRESFFRVQAPPAAPAGERDLFAETRQWAIEARSARLHKPHFLDARNPFLLQVFAKQARSLADGTVTFHECLPAADRYADPGAGGSAEEFFVEYTIEGNDHG